MVRKAEKRQYFPLLTDTLSDTLILGYHLNKGFVLDISGMKSVIFVLQIKAVMDCVQSKRTYVEYIQSVCLISHQVFLPIRCLYFLHKSLA